MMQPFPVAARAGDTVTLGVGSADGMTVANTTVSYVANATPGVSIDMTANVRAVFNLYADRRSAVYDTSGGSVIGQLNQAAGHEPWETVVVLDIPTTLVPGKGTVHVQTSASFPQWTGVIPNVSDVPIALEILPGQGSSNPFSYAVGTPPSFSVNDSNLLSFQPESSAVVRPTLPANSLGNTFGAISLTFNHALVCNRATKTMSATNINIVTEDLHASTHSQLQSNWSVDATQLKVNLLSSSGMTLAESRVTIVPYLAHFTGLPTLTAVHYYDLNGNEVSGPAIDQFAIASN